MTEGLDLETRLTSAFREIAATVPELPAGPWQETKLQRGAVRRGPINSMRRTSSENGSSNTRRRLLVAGIGVAAAMAVVATIVLAGGGGSTLSAQTVAVRTVAAIQGASNLIEVNERTIFAPKGVEKSTVWRYGNRVRIEDFSETGKPQSEAAGQFAYRKCSTGPCGAIEVNYSDRTWRALPSIAAYRGSNDSSPRPESSDQVASLVQQGINNHRLKMVGSKMLGGHTTLELEFPGAYGHTTRLWVDPSTYLPVKSVVFSGFTTTQEYQWLPASSANLPLLNIAIPAGFAHRG